MGHSFDSIIQIQEDLSRGKGTSIEVSLLMPLNGAGVIEDKTMENNEEKMNYRSCTVYLSRVRNAVRLEGKFEEQKTQEKMRTDMRKVLSAWLARYFDLSIFAILTGTQPPFEVAPGKTLELPYTIEPPTADRILYAGSATSEATITASDVFDTTLIGKARRMAQEDELTAVKPIRIDGRETYVMVIDPYQARDLRQDPKWLEAQEYANIRGETNPIFSGAMGVYEGVCIDRMFGLKKAQFKYDGTNWTDFGVINVLTSSVGD